MTINAHPLTQTDIESGLRRLGLEPGFIVEVHSSLRSFGTVTGGAETVVDAWGKIQAEAERLGLIRRGQIGQADCRLFKAEPVVGLYEMALRRDPFKLFGIMG